MTQKDYEMYLAAIDQILENAEKAKEKFDKLDQSEGFLKLVTFLITHDPEKLKALLAGDFIETMTKVIIEKTAVDKDVLDDFKSAAFEDLDEADYMVTLDALEDLNKAIKLQQSVDRLTKTLGEMIEPLEFILAVLEEREE